MSFVTIRLCCNLLTGNTSKLPLKLKYNLNTHFRRIELDKIYLPLIQTIINQTYFKNNKFKTKKHILQMVKEEHINFLRNRKME